MRIAYFDCFSGVSGDMILGALLDAGLPVEALRSELARLPIRGYTLDAQKVIRQGISGTCVMVFDQLPLGTGNSHNGNNGNGHGHAPSDLTEIISQSTLSEDVKQKALAAIRLLAKAGAALNGQNPSEIHLRELLGIHTAIYIVGAITGLAALGVESVQCSAINVGGGFIKTSEGMLPVPSPATAEILRAASVPIYGSDVQKELVTPAGAALMVALASTFGPIPPLTVDILGYGAGAADTLGNPNLMRLTIGELLDSAMQAAYHPLHVGQRPANSSEEWVTLIETNLDDMNPQYYDYLMEKLLKQGALDVFLVPVQMKKNRPGVVLSVLSKPETVDSLADTIFEETPTLGLRLTEIPRRTLHREVVQVQTAFGPINIRVAHSPDGKLLHVKPEYDDVKRAALEMNVPIDSVYEDARRAWHPGVSDVHQAVGRQRAPIMREEDLTHP